MRYAACATPRYPSDPPGSISSRMSQVAKRLLVLDDDPAVARTIALVARGQGYEVDCFADPGPFFEAVQSLAPSHVALDLIMPGMDGVEVLRRLAQLGCPASLILTSGMGKKVLESARVTASERGLNIVGVLPKPFRSHLLRELLAKGERVQDRPTLDDPWSQALSADRLADAIAGGRLTVVAQPKLHLASHAVVGVEMLARWNDAELGLVPPDAFIGVAERHGLMHALTHLVLEQSLDWFARSPLHASGNLAVNLSTTCLNDVGLADRIHSSCRNAGVVPEKLLLEITESSAMDRTADTFDTLTRLRLKGFQLSVDDFGTGYSSLAQLARLPLSEIKIDKSFVLNLLDSGDAYKIVDATIRLADSMGLVCVAEGVENAETMDALKVLECTLVQGYHISRPLPGPELDAWMARA